MKRRRDINLGATGCLCWETSTYSPDCCDPDDPKAEEIGRTRGPLTPPEPPPPPPPPEPSLGYGLLYNWYAATDVRGIAPAGWRVPTQVDVDLLKSNYASDSIAGQAIAGLRRQTDGHPYWIDGVISNNSSGFNFYGFGTRLPNGNYEVIINPPLGNDRQQNRIWSSSEATIFPTNGQGYVIANGADNTVSFTKSTGGQEKNTGFSIRCVRDTIPPSPTVTDIDGNIYSWVQIGSQYWLAQNLKTTKYNNGDMIPTGLDNAAWAATTDGAWAYPNGDSTLPI